MLARFRSWFVALHVVLWVGLIVAFLAISFPVVGPAVAQNSFGPIDPAHSIDNYLKGLTGIKNASQFLTDVFSQLPARQELIVVVNTRESPSEFLGMVVSYLAWPRAVRTIKIDRSVATTADIGSSHGGIVFAFVQPPAGSVDQIRLGANLVLIPSDAVTKQ